MWWKSSSLFYIHWSLTSGRATYMTIKKISLIIHILCRYILRNHSNNEQKNRKIEKKKQKNTTLKKFSLWKLIRLLQFFPSHKFWPIFSCCISFLFLIYAREDKYWLNHCKNFLFFMQRQKDVCNKEDYSCTGKKYFCLNSGFYL